MLKIVKSPYLKEQELYYLCPSVVNFNSYNISSAVFP